MDNQDSKDINALKLEMLVLKKKNAKYAQLLQEEQLKNQAQKSKQDKDLENILGEHNQEEAFILALQRRKTTLLEKREDDLEQKQRELEIQKEYLKIQEAYRKIKEDKMLNDAQLMKMEILMAEMKIKGRELNLQEERIRLTQKQKNDVLEEQILTLKARELQQQILKLERENSGDYTQDLKYQNMQLQNEKLNKQLDVLDKQLKDSGMTERLKQQYLIQQIKEKRWLNRGMDEEGGYLEY